MSAAATKQLLKAAEVADILGIGVRTVWRYAETGQIPAPQTIGRLKRWRRHEIEDFIGDQQPATPKTE